MSHTHITLRTRQIGLLLCFISTAALSQKVLTFSYTGAAQTFTVPCGVYTLNVKCWGAGGSGGGADSYIGAPGGGGGFVQNDVPVNPGQVLTICVGGGAGPGATNATCTGGGVGGWGNIIFNGGRGGNAGCAPYSGGGGGGGGATALYTTAAPLIVAAGGGGGSGGGQFSAGGAAGAGGQNGNPSPGSCSSVGMAGASNSGIGDQGQDKGAGDGAGGGGGGGGYSGGTGGGAPPGGDSGGCGGGGGISWSSGINPVIMNGNGQTPGNDTDPDLPAGVAAGGYNSAGGNGFMAITFIDGDPLAAFTNASGCLGTASQFTDNSTVASGTIAQWNWNFGDGTSAGTTQNPSHTYASAGTFSVTLTVTSSNGCVGSVTNTQTVYPNPVADFSATTVCNGTATQFSDLSTGGGNTWSWNFGDGTSAGTAQNPSHAYATPGNYTATFTVTALPGGCSSTSTHTIIVHVMPVANFTASNFCANAPTLFTDASTGATQWSWNFGDGTSASAVPNPSHTYSAAGTYTVTQTTVSTGSCSNTAANVITIFANPVADFSATTVCNGTATQFSDLSTGGGNTWSWNFGDGTSAGTAQNPVHTYANPGSYSATFTVTAIPGGCFSTTSHSITVNVLPASNFSATNVCANLASVFTDASSGAAQWSWNFGDGTPAGSTSNPSHTYLSFGTYTVTQTVTGLGGCAAVSSHVVDVYATPVVNFSDAPVCRGEATVFSDLSFINGGNITGWNWNFGDGHSTTVQNPSNLYSFSGTFNVSLLVTTKDGCTGTVSHTAVVHPKPDAEFSMNPSVQVQLIDEVNFTDLSNGTVAQHFWDFGDGNSSSLASPQHLYSDTGSYMITLIVISADGCLDTVQHPVEVRNYAFYMPNAFTPNGDSKNESFFGKGVGIKKYEMSIYNRWGKEVFHCQVNDLPQSTPCQWDGKDESGSSGQEVEEDVYVWKVNYTNIFNIDYSMVGKVSVIK